MGLHALLTPDIVKVVDLSGQRWENPIFLSREKYHQWAQGLDIPRDGETIIYPGVYEEGIIHIPTFRKKALEIIAQYGEGEEAIKKLEEELPEAYETVDPERRRVFEEPLRAITKLLKEAGVEFGYPYEEEPEPGFHQLTMGLDDQVTRIANETISKLKSMGVKRLITTSPAITKLVGHVYPMFVEELGLEIVHFLEVLDPLLDRLPGFRGDKEPVVVHDCHVWGRDLRERKIPDKLRNLLVKAGGEPVEPAYNREHVHCCGAPVGLVDPQTAVLAARNRLWELLEPAKASGAKKIVLTCPSCYNALYAALKKFGPPDVEMLDISVYAVRRLWGGVP